MYCPSCGTQQADESSFCASCGASLASAAPPATPSVTPPVVPPAVVPQAVIPQATIPQASVPAQVQPGVPVHTPQRPNKAGKTIALTLIGVLLLAAIGVGGYFAWDAFIADNDTDSDGASSVSDPAKTSSPVDEDLAPDTGSPAEPTGFATPQDALAEQLPDTWVYDTLSDDGEIIEYAIGPPASEYVDVVVVAQQPDGSWLVEEVHSFDLGDIDPGTSSSVVDEATFVVENFITAVAEDRADDAHGWTVSPFAEDPASASYSNGDLLGFSIVDAALQADGSTVQVTVDEEWAWAVERYVYTCIPTADGYLISNLEPF